MKNTLDTVLAYHQRTKHQLHRYAAGPGGLDWASQPDPFRTFSGAPRLELPLSAGLDTPYASLYLPQAIAAQAIGRDSIAALLQLAFGISAWKSYGGERWALRCNPSSGNLHPTEAYVVVGGCADLSDGVHHYVSRDHALELRCRFDSKAAPAWPPDSFLLGLSSIHWREAWKYGERAYRYCQHDAGHALAAVRYAAAALGWRVRLLSDWSDADIAAVLGLAREQDFGDAEREHADALLLVTKRLPPDGVPCPALFVHAARAGLWQGQANALSAYHGNDWPVIDEVAAACAKPATCAPDWAAPPLPAPLASGCMRPATEIIRQRRSAQSLDGTTGMSLDAFCRMLDRTLPRDGVAPWDAVGWQPRVHLLLFVHRVDGLTPGLYLFLRHPHIEVTLREELSSAFEWVRPQGCPEHFLLFRLVVGDARRAAGTLSCHQEIAADGAFSLGMLAEYESSLAETPWVYRQLFWESGMLGQVLYLEAEAAGLRGTGIGCYFDDAVHELIGLQGQRVQSLYHFTVGGALTDVRLQTLPAYAHLQRPTGLR